MTAAARGYNTACSDARHKLLNAIHKRISNRTTRHISNADFGRFHHIICLDKLDKFVLTDLMMRHTEQPGAKQLINKIHCLKSCEKYSNTKSTAQAPWDRLSNEIGFALTKWIFSVLGLKKPCTTPNAKWQTIEVEKIIIEERTARWERSWKTQGCEAHLVAMGDKQILFVSGPPEKVNLAKIKFRLLFSY